MWGREEKTETQRDLEYSPDSMLCDPGKLTQFLWVSVSAVLI